jgi:hypothetical protein
MHTFKEPSSLKKFTSFHSLMLKYSYLQFTFRAPSFKCNSQTLSVVVANTKILYYFSEAISSIRQQWNLEALVYKDEIQTSTILKLYKRNHLIFPRQKTVIYTRILFVV